MRRRDFLKTMGVASSAAVIPFLKFLPAEAAGRDDTLVVVSGNGPNSMDIQRKGTNRPSYQIAVNLYDRLVGYSTKTLANGTLMYDYSKLEPEAAESWVVSPDGMTITFKMRKGATFWDGAPITAYDVKWSFDRAVSLGGFPTVQMKAGSLEKPEQFEALDADTFVIKLTRPDKMTLPDLGVPVPIIFNSELAKKHATADDPWATEYLHRTPAGSGAFMLERWDPGQQVVYKRFEGWKNGELPGISRVIIREIPSASTRRALLEKGDADVSLEMPPKDFAELNASGKYTITGVPIENSMISIGLNLNFEPFANKLVRQAIAYSVPYDQIFKQAAFERGIPLWGGKSLTPATIEWPQPFPYNTDYDKAKALLTEAGYEQGFEVPLSFNLGLAQWSEPMCLLLQESLEKVGIKATIEKIPGANWRTAALVEKKLPMHIKDFGGWLNYPDYYSFWVYQKDRLFNSMNYSNPEVEKITDATLKMEVSDPQYEPNIKKLLSIFFEDVPLIPVYQPYLDVAMQKNITGYQYYAHRQLDCRSFNKASV
ncbi:ABC transporter substrate-binding protein [Sneathiella litorea]|uniref:ABC transporter substrate-binding protein n=1 Tax=Sneathiella litorea TaxID=2606216 RepID=A0A6L8WDD1_9PROT|nr:ABC transporter substrate-binding protein [Sneathiella litorea]MZR32382.1 ABC transporter substrate-binding protein [Sneathiella litorea]